MNLHLHTHLHHSSNTAVEIHSVVRPDALGRSILVDVSVTRYGLGSPEVVHLVPALVPAAQARLSQAVCAAPGTPAIVEGVDVSGVFAVVHLEQSEVPMVARSLEAIALAYLHENVWGGEDARVQ